MAAAADDRVDRAEPDEPRHQRLGVGRLREQVEVADRLLLPPERAGGSIDRTPGVEPSTSRSDSISRSAWFRSIRRGFCSSRSTPSRIIASVRSDRPRIVRTRPARAAASRSPSVRIPSRSWSWRTVFGPRPGIWSSSTRLAGTSGPEPLEVGHPAGRDVLGDLVRDRLADARHLGRVAGPIGGHEVDRAAPDRVGGAVVGDRLEGDLALDLEDVADLVEGAGEVAVRQVRRLVGEDVGRRLVVVIRRAGRVEVVAAASVGFGHGPMVAARSAGPARV